MKVFWAVLCLAFIPPYVQGEVRLGSLATGAGFTGTVLPLRGSFTGNPALGAGQAGPSLEIDSSVAAFSVPGSIGVGMDVFGHLPLGARMSLAMAVDGEVMGVSVGEWTAGWGEISWKAAFQGTLIPENKAALVADVRVGVGLTLMGSGGGDRELNPGMVGFAADFDLGAVARLGDFRAGLSALHVSGKGMVAGRSINFGLAYAPQKSLPWSLVPVVETGWLIDLEKWDLRVGLHARPFENLSLRLGAAWVDSFSVFMPTAGVSLQLGSMSVLYTVVFNTVLPGFGDHRIGLSWEISGKRGT